MFHNLGPLEGGHSIILVHWREGVPLSWSRNRITLLLVYTVC